jgi:hypothetical protein
MKGKHLPLFYYLSMLRLQHVLCPFMCLPVYRLFWVSSLAYPNLLGTKGYVVVVVVVVVVWSCKKPVTWFRQHTELG